MTSDKKNGARGKNPEEIHQAVGETTKKKGVFHSNQSSS